MKKEKIATEKVAEIIAACKRFEAAYGGFRVISYDNGGYHSYAETTIVSVGRQKMSPEVEARIRMRADATTDMAARLYHATRG